MIRYISIRLDYFSVSRWNTSSSTTARSGRIALLPSNASLVLPLQSTSSLGSWPRYILVSRQQFFFPFAYLPPTRPGCPSPLSLTLPRVRAVTPISALPTRTSPGREPSSSWDYHVTAQVAVWLVNHTWEELWVLVLKGYTTIPMGAAGVE